MGHLSGWDNRIKCTIDNTNIDDNQSNFPVRLHISAVSGIGDVDISCVFDELGSDDNRKKIAVTSSDGTTELYVEIERWDHANEQAELWTKVPEVESGSTTLLYLYYDADHADNDSYVGDTTDAVTHNVWDENFVGVWHMAQDPNGDVADAIKDSTSNQNDGTPAGSMTSADFVDGKIGKAIDFDGIDDLINCGNVSSINSQGSISVEAVLSFTATNTASYESLLSKVVEGTYEGFIFGFRNQEVVGSFNFTVNGIRPNIDIVISEGADTYIAGTSDLTDIFTYKNDALVDSSLGNSLSLDADTNPLIINSLSYLLNYCPQTEISEVRISDIDRSAAWVKATYYSNWDGLITFEFEEEEESLVDLNTEIAADFLTNFANLLTEIKANGLSLTDLESEIKAGREILTDLNVEASAKAQVIQDLLSEIQASSYTFHNLNTEIVAVRSKWWLKTEIKAGCAARWYFNTEWNPNRFLNTEIEAKKPQEFSFTTYAAEGYSATEPSVEFKITGYSFPLRTLFLDYIQAGGSNEYPLELWFARGLVGKGVLKNAKIRAEYVDTSDGGGFEVVTCDWVSIKIDGGEYQTVNETPATLGNIPCDSKLNVTLKVDCPDCALTRGLVFFKLIVTGDYCESIYGDSVVYRDGAVYHSGLQDDYESIEFISRLYVVA